MISAERGSDCQQLRALRARLLRKFPVNRSIYWVDLVASATVAWSAGALAAIAPPSLAVAATLLAAVATLRAAYFVHEISHQHRSLPGFELAWNALVGAWVLLPSFMADAHIDHHRLATYGTEADPEYAPIARWQRWELVGSVAAMPLVPLLLIARWGLIGPLSWPCPPLRRFVWAHLSTLQINPSYRRWIGNPYERRVIGYELMASAVVITAFIAIGSGAIPARVAWIWWAATSMALVLNQARTLLAHAYAGPGAPMTLAEQVADSATATRDDIATHVAYVLGTRFHALHHLAPQLPYHRLAAAHAWMSTSVTPACYRRTEVSGLVAGLAARWR